VTDLVRLDPHDEDALRAWWEVGHTATAERPGKPWPLWEQSRIALPADNPERGITLLGATVGGDMVGTGLLTRALRENLHAANVYAFVRPDHRRAGLGTALVRELEQLATDDARTTLQSEVFLQPGGRGGPEAFAARLGYTVANRESLRELSLADYVAVRDELRTEASARSEGYRIVTFDTICPEEHLESFGRLLGMLLSEIPLGELDLEDAEWTPERLRAAERRQVETGRHVHTALALAPDGEVAGASDVRVDDTDHAHGQVGISLVAPAHRGHRLGLALKLATHDLVAAAYPDLVSVDTSNAESNVHMNAVNDALGYRTIETLLEVQRRLLRHNPAS